MNQTKKHHLQPGTLLDDRYLIQSVLGEGGFGITYAGINQRINVRVAIKEFYWKDYVSRNAALSQDVHVLSEDNEKMLEQAKEKFMKEARVIGDFIEETSIVGVTDYFEANHTAYIVMNYLDGVTLKDCLKNKGPFPAEDMFRKLIPLAKGLGKVHDCGIIHRDISPDNIMMKPDGTLTLLDFGAARDYSAVRDKSYSVIVKGGYAPVEQYNSNSIQGPYTDIYALCATLYECIAGVVPDDALQRVFHDELKKPSDLGISIDKGLEKILMKGLRVSPEDRYQSTGEMLEDIGKILGAQVAEKKKSPWKLPVTIAAFAAVLILILAAAYTYADTHFASFKFRGIETETVVLVPDEKMSAKEFSKAKELIKERLSLLAGESNYLLRESANSTLTFTTPLDIYQDWDVSSAVKCFISRPGRMYVKSSEELIEITPEDYVTIDERIGRAQIIDPSKEDLPESGDYTYYELKLTAEKTALLRRLLSDTNEVTLAQDINLPSLQNYLTLNCYYQPDSDSFAFIAQHENFLQTLKYNISHEKFSLPFDVHAEIAAKWEDPEHSLIAGKNQKNQSEISVPAVCLKYTSSRSPDISNGQWYNVIADIKTRMDTLNIPYAFGVPYGQEHDFVIKLNREDADYETMMILGQTYASIQDTWENSYSYIADASVTVTEDGSCSLDIALADYDVASLTEKSTDLLENGDSSLYLNVGNCNLLELSLSEPLTDPVVSFSQLNRKTNATLTEEDIPFLNYLKSILVDTALPEGYYLDFWQATTSGNDIDIEYDLSQASILGLNKELPADSTLQECFPGCTVREYYSWGGKYLDVIFNLELNENFPQTLLDNFQQIYEAWDLGSGTYEQVDFLWGQNDENNTIILSAPTDTLNRKVTINGRFYGEKISPYLQELTKYLSNSDFYRNHADSSWYRSWDLGDITFRYGTNTKGD